MNKHGKDWLVLATLFAVAVGSRLLKEWGHISLPNLHAVSAAALFAGFYFSSRTMAAVVPLAAMMVSDAIIGGHHPLVMVSVYACLLAPVCLSRWFRLDPSRPLAIAGASLSMSILFFVVTNFATWCTPMYAHTWHGLVRCYVAAVPFFAYTMLGDLLYCSTIFGVYQLVTRRSQQPSLALTTG
jgi:hypothetical protein